MIDKEYITTVMTRKAEYQAGHNAKTGYLGFGMLYYAIVYMLKAKLCVCLGSGGGFVPRCMRQAQRDLKLNASQTILVDNLSEKWGETHWSERFSFFRCNFPDIDIWVMDTDDAFQKFRDFGDGHIDYIHIDADHGPQAIKDFRNCASVLSPRGVVTLHDTKTKCAVPELVKLIRDDVDWELINFPDFGAGIAVVRRVFDA